MLAKPMDRPNQPSAGNQPDILSLLDFCKGFLIIWIVYFHLNYDLGREYGNGLGWQGVHAFIVFSGFGLTYSCLIKGEKGVDWKQWFTRRVQRILPVYWVTCILGFFLVFLFAPYACDALTCVLRPAAKLFLEVSFLKVLSYKTMWSLKYLDHLWFVPLIISFYAIFPFLFSFLVAKGDVTKNCIRLFGIAALTEFLYRFLAIYFLNGYPIGHENGLLLIQALSPLNTLPEWFPFQMCMPFGLFPSRIGEFALGMLAAVTFVHHRQKLNKIFSGWIVVAGFLIWLMGSALVYINRFGWIASDLFISLGSIIVCVNLAWFSQKHSPSTFSMLSMLGVWSYYIYLIHNLFRYVWFPMEGTVISLLSSFSNTVPHSLLLLFTTKIIMLAIFGAVILLSSWLLMRFDQSKMPKWLIQNTIAKVLR